MSRRAKILAGVAGALAGAAAGAGAFWALTGPFTNPDQRVGAWTTNGAVGQELQGPYSRARVALYGIWGLPPTETLYFVATKDAAGAVLDRRCVYAVEGGALPTRWWGVTLYRDGFYIANPADRYSWTMTDTRIGPDGRWTLTLAPSGEGQNRLTFGPQDGRFQLLLRLYQPNPGVAEHRETVPVPTVRKVAC
ncbi:MAG: DUF1214 domain-containing protein [Phenylobacterium sp.]|uniref:DUF1214 domain-containing protein n=1 Tax=Phenylobacterium sp. TaxID=1871053 RepID=UPI001A43F153|nr:DUF1214 domain-containing protein [Phenylobacterium sp.]MBL8554116.1 DUF1214 domain-containing protein [Phenylobacterium sp.]